MTRAEILSFAKRHKLAVLSTVTAGGAPHGAVVGIAVGDDFELIFDTLASSRKYANLMHDPKIALVIGWDAETLQYEGVAEVLTGADLTACKKLYFATWPDGPARESWPGITYFRVKPRWLRYSDFKLEPAQITEMRF